MQRNLPACTHFSHQVL